MYELFVVHISAEAAVKEDGGRESRVRCRDHANYYFSSGSPYRDSFLFIGFSSRGVTVVGFAVRGGSREGDGKRSLRGAGGARRHGGEFKGDSASRRWAKPRETRCACGAFTRKDIGQTGGTTASLVRARERRVRGTTTTRRSPVKQRLAPDASDSGDEASGRCGT